MKMDRAGLIRLIHVGKRDLRLDDDTYRAILRRIGGKDSSSDLAVPALEKVLEHMKRSGFKVRTKNKAASRATARRTKTPPSRALDQHPSSKKIRALWLFLNHLGVVKDPSEAALAAYVKRIARVDALQWIDGEQAETLIESLKKWAMRFLPAAVKQLAKDERVAAMTDEERHTLNNVIGRAFDHGSFDYMHWAYEVITEALERSEA